MVAQNMKAVFFSRFGLNLLKGSFSWPKSFKARFASSSLPRSRFAEQI